MDVENLVLIDLFGVCPLLNYSRYVDGWLCIRWTDHEASNLSWGFLTTTALSYFQVTEYRQWRNATKSDEIAKLAWIPPMEPTSEP